MIILNAHLKMRLSADLPNIRTVKPLQRVLLQIYLPSWKLKPSTLEKVKPCCNYKLGVIRGKNVEIKKVRTKTTTVP